MIVPEFWAEAKERIRVAGETRTLKRFGWSDDSMAAAQEHARERVHEAAEQARRGESVRRVDHKVTYGGAEGLPIREEIVERHGDTVITRNPYGARCLNTPDVLFADVDAPAAGPVGLKIVFFAIILGAGAYYALLADTAWPFFLALIIAVLSASETAKLVTRIFSLGRDAHAAAYAGIETFANSHPECLLRVYRTPNGYRVLAMHDTFDPRTAETGRILAALGTDPVYAIVSRGQNCFRARLTAKPWRIDVPRLKPTPGIWPVKPEHMDKRRRWVADYERKAGEFSACRYETTLGSGRADRRCRRVQELHDRECRADRDLPLA
ncbi:MAG: hypothetical protein QNJ00_07905 [Woeseiaceae bacterium]|nr:hypothetical protein [Woeseiaceae bacterium]